MRLKVELEGFAHLSSQMDAERWDAEDRSDRAEGDDQTKKRGTNGVIEGGGKERTE